MSFARLAKGRFASEMSSIVHSMAEFSSSAMTIRNSDMIITAVETALTGRMIANGVRIATKIRSSRNDGSCFTAAQKPSTAQRTDEIKLLKLRCLDSGGGTGSLTRRVERVPEGPTNQIVGGVLARHVGRERATYRGTSGLMPRCQGN